MTGPRNVSVRQIGPNTTPVDLTIDGNDYVELRDRLVQAEAEVARLRDELDFQAKNAAVAHSERARQFRRAADALEALSDIGDLLAHHRCAIRQDRPADVHPKVQEALDIIRVALGMRGEAAG